MPITGGAGFIGHNTAIYLRERGVEVVVLDSLERSTEYAVRRLRDAGVSIIRGDVGDSSTVGPLVGDSDVVIHAAAYIDVHESMQRPADYVRNNVVGTTVVAHECLRHGKPMVFISSAAVYGNPVRLPIPEDHPLRPISPYGLSKVLSEEVVRFFGGLGLRFVILRPFNVYGPGQNSAYAGVIMRFIERVKRGLPPVIYGDGNQARDFIHVLDVARVIERVITGDYWGETFNVGTGVPTRIIDLARLVMGLFGMDGEPLFDKPRPGDIRDSYADISKARSILGFTPSISLEDGLRGLMYE